MKNLLVIILLLLTISKTFGQNNDTENEEDNVGFDIKQIALGLDLREQIVCNPVNRSEINLLLYVRNNHEPIELNSTTINAVSPDKKLIIIIHGWLGDTFSYGMQDLKDAYLKRYDCNVVIVNWKNIAHQMYSTSVCKLPKVAEHVVNLLLMLKEQRGILPSNVHILGHSLGGQMSGLTAQKYFNQTGEKIDRVTGLDPAGPLFVDEPRYKRIDSTDAVFVDIIHTNGGMFGYYGNCGTADFYINCGSTQPNCYIPDLTDIKMHNVKDLGVLAVACSHMRSFDYMIKAVNNEYQATPCSYCPLGCPPILSFFKNKTVMGEDCERTASGGYFISM